jgi:general stress protein CsbA
MDNNLEKPLMATDATLLDYFAAHAMSAYLLAANSYQAVTDPESLVCTDTLDVLVYQSYLVADKMITERKREFTNG